MCLESGRLAATGSWEQDKSNVAMYYYRELCVNNIVELYCRKTAILIWFEVPTTVCRGELSVWQFAEIQIMSLYYYTILQTSYRAINKNIWMAFLQLYTRTFLTIMSRDTHVWQQRCATVCLKVFR